jgi:hypothetical protein
MYVTERQKGTTVSQGTDSQGVYATERDKSFGLRLRYQCREVFSLALTHFSVQSAMSRRISKEVTELQAPGLTETLIE